MNADGGGVLRAEPELFGTVASDPTVSRRVDVLAVAGPKTLTAIRRARAQVTDKIHCAVLAVPDTA